MSSLTPEEVQKLIDLHGGDDAVRRFLAKGIITATNKNDMVFVGRTILPTYPKWVKEILYPPTGPAEFDVGKLKKWLHEGQKKNSCVSGNIIHQYLKDHDMIKDCLGLQDLEAIQKKGLTFFQKHFNGEAVFGWKSVVRNRYGGLNAPSLCECGGEVCLRWYWLDDDWRSGHPALLLAS